MNDSKAHFPIGLEIYETSRSLRRHFDRRARSLGFTQGQWRALLKLDYSPGSSQAALAELLDMQPISLARILDRMVAGGLVERRPDPADRRAVKLYLTPQAGPVLTVLRDIAADVRATATRGISQAEQDQLIATLRKMRANIDELDEGSSQNVSQG